MTLHASSEACVFVYVLEAYSEPCQTFKVVITWSVLNLYPTITCEKFHLKKVTSLFCTPGISHCLDKIFLSNCLSLPKESSIKCILEIFRKTNISNPLLRTRTCAHQGIRNVSFSETFAYVLNEWPLSGMSKSSSAHAYKSRHSAGIDFDLPI